MNTQSGNTKNPQSTEVGKSRPLPLTRPNRPEAIPTASPMRESGALKRKERDRVSHMLLKAEEGTRERVSGSRVWTIESSPKFPAWLSTPTLGKPWEEPLQKAPVAPFLCPLTGEEPVLYLGDRELLVVLEVISEMLKDHDF